MIGQAIYGSVYRSIREVNLSHAGSGHPPKNYIKFSDIKSGGTYIFSIGNLNTVATRLIRRAIFF